MRPGLFWCAALILFVMMGAFKSSAAFDVIEDPPIVEILNLDGLPVDSVQVDVGETFTLIGIVAGNQPFVYTWEQNGVAFGSTQVIWDHHIELPGAYTIVLTVVDMNGLSGSDTCYVEVVPIPVPTETLSWGAIKELYRQL